MDFSFLDTLTHVISQRHNAPSDASYTSKLIHSGLDRILKKIGEEAGEVIIAAKNKDAFELKNESADLLFHLMVLLEAQGLTLGDVVGVLKDRHH